MWRNFSNLFYVEYQKYSDDSPWKANLDGTEHGDELPSVMGAIIHSKTDMGDLTP